MNRRLFAVSIVAVAAIVLTGCGGSEESGSNPGNGSVNRDATIRIAVQAGHTSWDPHLVESPGAATTYLTPVYDTLIQMKPQMDGFEPGMATSWEYDATRTTLTMKLRAGITFQDGAKFDADAAKASLDRAKTTLTPGAGVTLDSVTSVDVVDPATIKLTLSEPDPNLEYALSTFAGMMISPDQVTSTNLGSTPAGSGPYEPVPGDSSQTKIVLKRFDKYWNPDTAQAARIEINTMPDDLTRLNAFRAGEIDVSYVGASGYEDAKAYAAQQPGKVDILPYEGFATDSFFTNIATNPALENADVRRALSIAIDRKTISEQLLGGACVPTEQVLAPGVVGYLPDLDKNVTYDPDEAKKLLAGAGFSDLKLQVLAPTADPYGKIAEVVQAEWKAIGVELKLTPIDPSIGYATFSKPTGSFFSADMPAGPVAAQAMDEYVGRTSVDSAPADMKAKVAAARKLDPASPAAKAAYEEISQDMVDAPVNLVVCRQANAIMTSSDVVGADKLTWMRAGVSFDPRNLGKTS